MNKTTEYRDSHNQSCPDCGLQLETREDYIGGGSHYWVLWCSYCKQKYSYDTYRWELEKVYIT